MAVYKNSLEHLIEELRRIDLIVSLGLEKCRKDHGGFSDEFQGLYISEDEVNRILTNPPYEYKTDDAWEQQLQTIEMLNKDINQKKDESIKQGKELRLHLLTELFHLRAFEVDTILICLASELDLRYEKLYSYMQNDVTKKRPTVDLVIKVLCSSFQERLRGREYFLSTAPLIRNRLVTLSGDGQELTLLSRSIRIDERITSFLLGTDSIDRRIENFSSIIEPKRSFDDVIFEDEHKNWLSNQIEQLSSLKNSLIFFLHGAYGTGKKMFAEVVCKKLGMRLLIVNSKILMRDESFENLGFILREAKLQKSCVYLEGIDVLWKENNGSNMTYLMKELDGFPNQVFLSGELELKFNVIPENHKFIDITFLLPSFGLRKKMWESFLDGNSQGVDISALAIKFKLSAGQMRDAIITAQKAASSRCSSKISMEDIYYGCKSQSNKNLSNSARKIEPRHNWKDIVLPKDTKDQLKDVCRYIKHKGKVYTDWGFDKKLSLGKGLNVLFSGASGTGKTMAAEIIAKYSGLDLYKIDLSNVVSKYIGETEKNLKNIFLEAETSNAIIFFDEADALFGKRTEVRDSHDRYSNIEINYLLQKMEEYEGIVILATNFGNNIDEAFLRRMHFKIEFTFPDAKLREKIWKNIFPSEILFEEGIDFCFLSNFKITGGNIRNIALNAAFFAADNCGKINMEHIIKATKREFQKIGKLCVKEDFGDYYKFIEGI